MTADFLKTLLAFLVAAIFMLVFRALVLTVYTVSGDALEPCFVDGDRVLVNRWSYGLRTGGSRMFAYTRWFASPVEKGDLVVFNSPADSTLPVSRRAVCGGYCAGVPGDSIKTANTTFTVPGKHAAIAVTEENVWLISMLYTRYEGRKTDIKAGKLLVNGKTTKCATFTKDYYLMVAGRSDKSGNKSFHGLVPEDHIIGKVSMLLFSTDSSKPTGSSFRSGRQLLLIKKKED